MIAEPTADRRYRDHGPKTSERSPHRTSSEERGRGHSHESGKTFSALIDLVIVSVLVGLALTGCATSPPEEDMPEPEPVSSSPDEIVLDARLLAGNNDFESASSMLEDLLEHDRNNIEAMKLLASIYTAMGRNEEASAKWERMAVLDPSDPDATYEAAVILARNKDWQGVRSSVLAAERAGAAETRHYLLIGEADIELGYRQEAEKYLERTPGSERSNLLLGKLFYSQGMMGRAENHFSETLRYNPDNYSAHLHMGWLKYSSGELNKALRHYKRAIEVRPEDPIATLSLAALLEKMNRIDDSINYLKKALSFTRTPKDKRKEAYNSLSRLLVEREEYADAISVIRKGLEEFPESGGLHYQWGELLLRNGRKSEAAGKYKIAAEDPAWKELALRRLYSIQGNR